MRVIHHSPDFALTDAIRAHILRSLKTSLRRHAHVIERVDVFVRDQNGPRGGVDKRVVLNAQQIEGHVTTTVCASDDLYRAVAVAARRLRHALTRARRRRRRRPAQHRAGEVHFALTPRTFATDTKAVTENLYLVPN